MNRYTLAAESGHWWLPSAAAGLVTSVVIAAIAWVPVTTDASASEPRGEGWDAATPVADVVDDARRHRCFMLRASWNPGLDGNQPWCLTRVCGADSIQRSEAVRERGLRQLDAGV